MSEVHMTEPSKKEKQILSLEEEVRFLRERESAISHFLYGVAFGILIFSVLSVWGNNER